MNGNTRDDSAIGLLIVDDHPVVLEGLEAGLGQFEDIEIRATAAGSEEARRLIDAGDFDLILTDLNLPEINDGLELVRYAAGKQPGCKIVVLTYSDNPENVFRANEAGAHAYLVKDSDVGEIASALRTVMAGGRPPLKPKLEAALWRRLRAVTRHDLPYGLTEREWEILRLITNGATNDEIAAKLYISSRAVRRTNTSIFDKLSVRNRAEAAAKAVSEGFFS